MARLTAQEILAKLRAPAEVEVDIPEWGGTVLVRRPRQGEAQEIQAAFASGGGRAVIERLLVDPAPTPELLDALEDQEADMMATVTFVRHVLEALDAAAVGGAAQATFRARNGKPGEVSR